MGKKGMKKYKIIAICLGIIHFTGLLLALLTLTDKGYFFDGQLMTGFFLIIGSYVITVIFIAILIGKYGK